MNIKKALPIGAGFLLIFLTWDLFQVWNRKLFSTVGHLVTILENNALATLLLVIFIVWYLSQRHN